MKLKSFWTNAALILTTLMLAVAAATAQTYTDLFNFDGTHGRYPVGALAQGRDGNLYATTAWGGVGQCSGEGCGVVFRITPSGTLKVLYKFDGGIDGGVPFSGLTLGTDGDFWGTTQVAGDMSCIPPYGCGTIFKITKRGSLTTLYSFPDFADGADPFAPPIQGAYGNFYGTTSYGTVYKITSSGTYTSLGHTNGESFAPLLQGTDGNFYGTTNNGGKNPDDGTVFKMTPKGVEKVVYNFDGTHGANPYFNSVIQGSDGNFYGTTLYGGSYGYGVVFQLTPQGALTVLHNFGDPNYLNDGEYPWAGLVQATDSNFYGTAASGGAGCGCGVIFQVTLAGAYSILYNLDGIHGAGPESPLMQHTNGKIYGLTFDGGPPSYGVVYSFDMGLGPFVSFVGRLSSGKVGQTIEILGQGFTGTTGVSFNGTAATFVVRSDTYLRATVPYGATTGFVTVTTPSGTLTSNQQFRVKP